MQHATRVVSLGALCERFVEEMCDVPRIALCDHSRISGRLGAVGGPVFPRRDEPQRSASPFQYANRLAFLRFLREVNGENAHLMLIYFTHDSDMGCATEAEYRGAIRLMDACLGLGKHSLATYVHKIFIDVRRLGTP